MAVVKCKECGGQVSNQAASCPACGAKAPKKTTAVTWFAAFAVVAVSLNFVLRDEAPSTPAPPMSAEQKAQGVQTMQRLMLMAAAERIVKTQLKDPESAVFSSAVFREPGFVCGYVNAKNSYGGFTGNKGYLFNTTTRTALIEGHADSFASTWRTRCI